MGPYPATGTYFGVGLHDPFYGYRTPVWMRFNFATPHFATVRANLEASHLRQRLVYSGKHVWIPLDVPLGADQPAIDAVIRQAREVIQVAYRDSPGFTAITTQAKKGREALTMLGMADKSVANSIYPMQAHRRRLHVPEVRP